MNAKPGTTIRAKSSNTGWLKEFESFQDRKEVK